MKAEVLLSKRNSLVLKGGGILLMLFHHLFYSEWSRPLYDDITIHGVGLVNQLGIFSKLCLAVFVFASGYGLTVSTPSDIKLKDFYLHRFKKLYMNYWFVWLLFVPVSVFVFGRTFMDAYGDHVVGKTVLDFFGLLKMFGYDSYNPTWWFYNCIIILYLLFPLLNKYLWTTAYLVISVALFIALLGAITFFQPIIPCLTVFIAGMFMAKVPLSWLNGSKVWHIVIALILLCLWRGTKTCPRHIAEPLICVGLSILIYKARIWQVVRIMFEELGKHSMNMFLIHTFIFYFWFTKFVYITRNPLIIFITLVIMSYLTSLILEWIKNKMGFYKF